MKTYQFKYQNGIIGTVQAESRQGAQDAIDVRFLGGNVKLLHTDDTVDSGSHTPPQLDSQAAIDASWDRAFEKAGSIR